MPTIVSPDLLAHHTEQAELWIDAATANFRAARRNEELFLNQEAIQWYGRAVKAVSRMHQLTGYGAKIATLAHRGEAGVHLRVGAYGLAEAQASKMRLVATDPGDQAEADRLVAGVCLHTGRIDEAERLLTGALLVVRDNTVAREVVLHILYDLAELCHRTGQARRGAKTLARMPSDSNLRRWDGHGQSRHAGGKDPSHCRSICRRHHSLHSRVRDCGTERKLVRPGTGKQQPRQCCQRFGRLFGCGRSFSASPRALGADRRRRVHERGAYQSRQSCDEPGRVPSGT